MTFPIAKARTAGLSPPIVERPIEEPQPPWASGGAVSINDHVRS
jgi:hypothetical protein